MVLFFTGIVGWKNITVNYKEYKQQRTKVIDNKTRKKTCKIGKKLKLSKNRIVKTLKRKKKLNDP